MKVMIIGAGYVGLTMGVVLSATHEVTLLDVDEDKVKAINEMKSPIHEKGMSDLLTRGISEGRLRAMTPEEILGRHDVVLICVGTPSSSDGSVDLSYVESAAAMVLERANEIFSKYCVIGIKSTVPPGTTRRFVLEPLDRDGLTHRTGAAFNPEFLREGSAIEDAQKPDRIVIGASDAKALELVKRMYEECLTRSSTAFVETSLESAELCKYVSNSFLALKISFANEIANIVEKIPGANFAEVMLGVGLDSRIAPSFFGAGAGYGGSCFPKDVSELIHLAQHDLSVETPILKATQRINSERPRKLVDMLLRCIPDVHGVKISVLGLAFKPETDDIRESPSLSVIEILQTLGAEVWVHDPLLNEIQLDDEFMNSVTAVDDIDICLTNASGCILMTNWENYANTGLDGLTRLMKKKIFIDGRRAFVNDSIPSDVVYTAVGKHPDS
jgi:UDPglucose 6-dehydrogenase